MNYWNYIYVPYAFGSGFIAYRIKGEVVKLSFDGKDDWITIFLTPKCSTYPPKKEKEIFSNTYTVFKEKIDFITAEIINNPLSNLPS